MPFVKVLEPPLEVFFQTFLPFHPSCYRETVKWLWLRKFQGLQKRWLFTRFVTPSNKNVVHHVLSRRFAGQESQTSLSRCKKTVYFRRKTMKEALSNGKAWGWTDYDVGFCHNQHSNMWSMFYGCYNKYQNIVLTNIE